MTISDVYLYYFQETVNLNINLPASRRPVDYCLCDSTLHLPLAQKHVNMEPLQMTFEKLVANILKNGIYNRIVDPMMTKQLREERSIGVRFICIIVAAICTAIIVPILIYTDSQLISWVVAIGVGFSYMVFCRNIQRRFFPDYPDIQLVFRVQDLKNHFTVKFIRRTKVYSYFVTSKNEVTLLGVTQPEEIDVRQADFVRLMVMNTPVGPELLDVVYFVRSKLRDGGFIIDVLPMSTFKLKSNYHDPSEQISQSLLVDMKHSAFSLLLPTAWIYNQQQLIEEFQSYQQSMKNVVINPSYLPTERTKIQKVVDAVNQ